MKRVFAMAKLLIDGNRKLNGEISVQGSKNSILPILAATVLCSEQCILHNCPDILDVDFSIKILEHLGGKVSRSGKSIIIDMRDINRFDIPDDLMKEMRSSIIFLGAIISRVGKARLTSPGGCQLGPRPIDFHINSLKEMGVCVDENLEYLNCKVDKALRGTNIILPFPSVGATENIILAAVLSSGTTTIENMAKEPEIIDLIGFLNSCGAKIKVCSNRLTIEGVKKLHGTEYKVMPDRIVAATFMSAVATTGGRARFKNVISSHLTEIIKMFRKSGCEIDISRDSLLMKAPDRLKSIKKVITAPYPGFPTDAQALFLAAMATAEGESVFVENVFQQRYKHVNELLKMGADISVCGSEALVRGVKELHSAQINATDLRGAAALVIAALKAQGTTTISNLRHLDRGYENLEENLTKLGAKIQRV